MEQHNQLNESNDSILSLNADKIENYNELLQKVILLAKSATNEMEKSAGYAFIVLLKSAINETNNLVLLFLRDAIEHLLKYFSEDLQQLLDKNVDWENSYNGRYYLLQDLIKVILQSVSHKQNLEKFREFCLQI